MDKEMNRLEGHTYANYSIQYFLVSQHSKRYFLSAGIKSDIQETHMKPKVE